MIVFDPSRLSCILCLFGCIAGGPTVRKYVSLTQWGVIGLFFLWGLSAHASDRVCKQWYQKQQYIEASRCFYSIAQEMMKSKLSAEQRESVGNWIRNAILALRKAADQTKSTENAAHLREQAIRYLEEYLQKKLYDSETQKRSAEVQRTRLLEQVGYAQLTITTNHPQAAIQVTGFRFSQSKTGVWSDTLRPGNYTVLVKHPNGSTKAKVIQIVPRQPQAVDMAFPNTGTSPPKPPSPITPASSNLRVVSWILFGLAGATAITSAIFFGVGLSDQTKADALYNTKVHPIASGGSATDTQELIRLQNESNRNLTIAWVGASIAVTSAVVGMILYALQPPTSQPPKTTPASPSSTRFHAQSLSSWTVQFQ